MQSQGSKSKTPRPGDWRLAEFEVVPETQSPLVVCSCFSQAGTHSSSSGSAMQPCTLSYQLIPGPSIDQTVLAACAELFSRHYGVWAVDVARPLKPGSRVKMNAERLRQQSVSDPDRTVLARCTVMNAGPDGGKDELVGHAFATIWDHDGEQICWITQLVVAAPWRECGIATNLLRLLPGSGFRPRCSAMGIASSHPAACLALAKRARVCMRKVDVAFIRSRAPRILASTTVDFLKTASLRGPVFQATPASDDEDVVSSAFTSFHVDHQEPLAAMQRWEDNNDLPWPLGKLLPGHEFILIVPLKDVGIRG